MIAFSCSDWTSRRTCSMRLLYVGLLKPTRSFRNSSVGFGELINCDIGRKGEFGSTKVTQIAGYQSWFKYALFYEWNNAPDNFILKKVKKSNFFYLLQRFSTFCKAETSSSDFQ
jgi:hypothetical protein